MGQICSNTKVQALMPGDIGVQYKDPDSNTWIVLSHDDFEVLDLLQRAKTPDGRQYKLIEVSVFEGRSPQVTNFTIC
jgi:hypothetical protein